jgi:hypothetical protein
MQDQGSGQRIGARLAVDAARKGIFFVELMRSEEARAAVAEGFPAVAGAATQLKHALGRRFSGLEWEFERDQAHYRAQLLRLLGMVRPRTVEDLELRARWATVLERVREEASASEIDALLSDFLENARSRFARGVEDLVSIIWRNFAMLSGAVVIAVILGAVEQVSSLLLERSWYALVAALTVLPVLGGFLLSVLLANGRTLWLPPWFERWARFGLFSRWAARYPTGYDVTHATARTGRRILLSAAYKTTLYVGWLLILAAMVGLLVPPELKILKTVVWAACMACFGLTLLRLLDLWDFVHPAPVRGVFLSFGALLWLIYSANDVSLGIAAAVAMMAFTYLAVTYWTARRALMPLFFSLLPACAGVLSLIYSEESTNKAEAWRAPASAAGSVAAPPVWLGPEEWPHPDDGSPVVVVAASGGGSRAALLATLALKALSDTCRSCSEQGSNERCYTLSDHLQLISSVSGGSLASATYLSARLHGQNADELPAKMADDFLQPVLRGIFDPGISRGRSLEEYWTTELGLRDRLSSLAKAWRDGLKASRPPLPIPIFNSATLDGHVVAISPLSWADRYRDAAEIRALENNEYRGREDPTWVYYRWGVYSIDQLVPEFDPNLAQAVRASANFPFGFPLVEVETTSGLPFSPVTGDRSEGDKERVRLTDGGVVSNSGVWTLFRVLRAHADLLKRRGVVLILVDASKMPTYQGRTRTFDLLMSLFDRSPTAGNLHTTMLDHLGALFEQKLAVVELAMPPETKSNFYTSWALDRLTLDRLRQAAAPEVATMVKTAGDAFCTLRNGEELGGQRLTTRLPLD